MNKFSKLFLNSSLFFSSVFISSSCNFIDIVEKPKTENKKNVEEPKKKENSSNLNVEGFPFKYTLEEFRNLYPISNQLKAYHSTTVTPLNINDGDTFSFELNGLNEKLRFNGVDTPEMGFTNNGKYQKTVGIQREYAEKATTYSNLFLNYDENIKGTAEEVIIVPIKTKGGQTDITDKYGRNVGQVYYRVDNYIYNFSAQLIWYGLGRKAYISNNKSSNYYVSDTNFYNAIIASDKNAKEHNLGIYSVHDYINEIYPKK